MAIEINTSLYPSQAKFVLWIEEKMPYLMHLFDIDDRVYNAEKVEKYLSVASSGEIVMARFVLSVWRGDNDFKFDITEAARSLDKAQMEIVTDWLTNPFWP